MSPRAGLTPEHVIATAVELVDVEGADALTLARVAARLGVRTPSLYNHVAGLPALRRAVRLRALELLRLQLQDAAVGRARADALYAMAFAYRQFVSLHPGLHAMTVPTTQVEDAAIRELGARILNTILAALSGYGLRDHEAVHAARAYRSAIHGFVTLEAAGGFGLPTDVDRSFHWMLVLLIGGLDQLSGS